MHAHRKPGAPAKTTQKHNLLPKKAKIPPCTFEKEAGTYFKGVHLVHLPSEVHLSCLRSPRSPHPIRHLRSTTSDVRTSQAHTNRTQRSASLPPLSACAWARAFADRSCGFVGANATRAYPSGSQSRIFSDGFQVRAIKKASSNTKLCSRVVGVLDGAYRTKTHFAKPFRAFQVKPTLSSCSRYTRCRLAETRNWCTERGLECSAISKPSPALSTAALTSVTQHSLVCGVWKLSDTM